MLLSRCWTGRVSQRLANQYNNAVGRCLSSISVLSIARSNVVFSTPISRQQSWRRNLLTLAIETSCDDTCVAILEKQENGRESAQVRQDTKKDINASLNLFDNSVYNLHFHEKITLKNAGHGGIHPIEALESHQSNLASLVEKSLYSLPPVTSSTNSTKQILLRGGSQKQKPDFVTVTRGPGMRSNLNCGIDLAKGLSLAWPVPLLGVHHMQAHALTPRLVHALDQHKLHSDLRPAFPFLTLLVSGGHTMLVHSTDLITHKILATTADIAIGDALDKAGRRILPEYLVEKADDTAYGKHLSKYAFPSPDTFDEWPIPKRRGEEMSKPPNKFGWQIQTAFSDKRDMTFSFAGIWTRADSLMEQRARVSGEQIPDEERLLLARTVLGAVFEHLGSRTIIALEELQKSGIRIPTLVVSGGVAANDFLRHYLRSMLDVRGFKHIELIFPPVQLCTDNAAMIAWTGMEMYEAGYRSELDISSLRKWSMDGGNGESGIIGVGGWYRE